VEVEAAAILNRVDARRRRNSSLPTSSCSLRHVALGSLVDAPTIRPGGHIFVGSKASWFEITDDLPQFEELD
jgi:hypothetical protein